MLVKVNKNYEIINDYVEDKEVFETKVLDELPSDVDRSIYVYKYDHLEVKKVYDFEDARKKKYEQLDKFINYLKENGVEYQEKMFKADQEAETNVTKMATLLAVGLIQYPITWFTRNGESGAVQFESQEEFVSFLTAISTFMANLTNKYYAIKYQIDQAKNENELDKIKFE